MRTNMIYKGMWKAAGVTLLISGFGLLLNSPVLADDPSCCNTKSSPSCADCDKIFTNAGSNLSDELQRLTKECCAPKACDSKVCDADSCDGQGCDNECDWCNLGDPWTLQDAIFGDRIVGDGDYEAPFTVGGWTQWGYTSSSTGIFNRNPNSLNNDQTYLYIERVADGSDGWGWGFRGDLMYGTNAFTAQSFGNPAGNFDFANGWDNGIYGWAMPQLYGEVANGDLSIKFGHFYTIAGYETVTAPDNFFYSHSFSHFNSEPFTHTGALATYQVNDDVEVYGGWTAGWDTGFDQLNNGSSFLGGFKVALNDNMTYTYVTTFGEFGARGNGYHHSQVLDVNLTEKWNYVFSNDVFTSNNTNDHQIGFNQYLFYTVNDCLKYGTRVEWWKTNAAGIGGTSVYQTSVGVNYRPHANLVIRPEWRYQWSGNNAAINGLGLDPRGSGIVDKGILGVDAILTF